MKYRTFIIILFSICLLIGCSSKQKTGQGNSDNYIPTQYIGFADNAQKKVKSKADNKSHTKDPSFTQLQFYYKDANQNWRILPKEKQIRTDEIRAVTVLKRYGHGMIVVDTKAAPVDKSSNYWFVLEQHIVLFSVAVFIFCGLIIYLIYRIRKKRKNNSAASSIQSITEEEKNVILFKHSPIYEAIQQMSGDENAYLSTEQWEELQTEIDRTYNNFSKRLLDTHPSLTEIELHICLLVKAQIPVSEIPHLSLRAKSSVASIRSRLYSKLFGTNGSAQQMDDFINQF